MFSYWTLSWIEPMTVPCETYCLNISKVEKYIDELAEKNVSCDTARFNNQKLLGYCSYAIDGNGDDNECASSNAKSECLPEKCIKYAKIFIFAEKTTFGECFHFHNHNHNHNNTFDIMEKTIFDCPNKKIEKIQLIMLGITVSSIVLFFLSLIISGCFHKNIDKNANIPANNYVIIANTNI